MEEIDVCLCEPFILPGILPTLGLATINSELRKNGLRTKMIYPSVRYFIEQKLFEDSFLLSLVEDTPLQLVEYLFVDPEREYDALEYIYNSLSDKYSEIEKGDLVSILRRLHDAALKLIEMIASDIARMNPHVLCISTTFGDLNFDVRLIEEVKELNPQIKIVCGGSNCDLEYSGRMMKITNALDVVVCDETGFVSVKYIRDLIEKKIIDEKIKPYLTTREHLADKIYRLHSLDELPCPDFDDFFETTKKLGINNHMLTLPYEFARGCWWGEEHPCAMCGFFGNQKKYVHKKPQKVIREIEYLVDRYHISRIRFTDLVNPKINILKMLSPLEKKHIKFFWELRPDMSEQQVALLRRIGLTCGQIGIESFSTDELCVIKKGTIGISNIYVLRLLSEYKIEVMWNYLYGFTDDQAEWYENIIEIIPSLFHLQPPSVRKIWINRFSDLYYCSEQDKLVPLGDGVFHNEKNKGFDFFYKMAGNRKMEGVYTVLRKTIDQWKEAFSQDYSLLVIPECENSLLVERRYGKNRRCYRYSGIVALIYCYFAEPHTYSECQEQVGEMINVKEIICVFEKDETIISLDGKYLSIACFPTRYRWTKYYLQPSYAGRKLFEEDDEYVV